MLQALIVIFQFIEELQIEMCGLFLQDFKWLVGNGFALCLAEILRAKIILLASVRCWCFLFLVVIFLYLEMLLF